MKKIKFIFCLLIVCLFIFVSADRSALYADTCCQCCGDQYCDTMTCSMGKATQLACIQSCAKSSYWMVYQPSGYACKNVAPGGGFTGQSCQKTTLIELAFFEAIPGNREVNIVWITESEIDNVGFNLYRAESEDGEYVKINDSLIPAEGSSTQGASYEFFDNNVQNKRTYYYALEDIDLNGVSTVHGPVNATPKRMIRGER